MLRAPLRNRGSQTRRWREVDSNFPFRALNERRTVANLARNREIECVVLQPATDR